MRYLAIFMDGRVPPSNNQIERLLSVMNDVSALPVFIHCKNGVDRTGTMIACYRIAHDTGEIKAALAEARSYGQKGMQWRPIYVPRWIPGMNRTFTSR